MLITRKNILIIKNNEPTIANNAPNGKSSKQAKQIHAITTIIFNNAVTKKITSIILSPGLGFLHLLVPI